MEKDLISIVIPTFNDPAEKLLCSLQSVLEQSYQNIEVIVVDDGSDQPFAGLQENISDENVLWIASEQNKGVAETRNIGINAANGEYIALLDTGDWWEKNKLELQVKKIKENSANALVFSGVVFHPVNSKSYEFFPKEKKDWVASLLVSQPIVGSASSVLIKKTIIDQIGLFYVNEDIPEDRDYWLRVALKGEIAFVNDLLVHIELPEHSRSSNPEKKRITYLNFIKKHEMLLKNKGLYKQAYCTYHGAIAQKFFMKDEVFEGIKESYKALRYAPRAYILYRALIASICVLPSLKYSKVMFFLRSKG
ncbi:glycosyltransferase family 2 protein [Neptuniibacter sp. PT8_73]|uniref:glycosyltransferase family 2 protein n=1 Tax=unclassified Neptuniibacter TaxID=2630693 RepID=UPI0039F7297D